MSLKIIAEKRLVKLNLLTHFKYVLEHSTVCTHNSRYAEKLQYCTICNMYSIYMLNDYTIRNYVIKRFLSLYFSTQREGISNKKNHVN